MTEKMAEPLVSSHSRTLTAKVGLNPGRRGWFGTYAGLHFVRGFAAGCGSRRSGSREVDLAFGTTATGREIAFAIGGGSDFAGGTPEDSLMTSLVSKKTVPILRAARVTPSHIRP